MPPEIVFIKAAAFVGWFLLLFTAVMLWGANRTNSSWQKLCAAKNATIRELERKNIVCEMDAERAKWLEEEHARLSRKCAAICRQIRKAKGRGRVTCQSDPMHNF